MASFKSGIYFSDSMARDNGPRIRLLPVKKGNWEGVIESIPGLAKKISTLKDKIMSAKDKDKDEPEPEDTEGEKE